MKLNTWYQMLRLCTVNKIRNIMHWAFLVYDKLLLIQNEITQMFLLFFEWEITHEQKKMIYFLGMCNFIDCNSQQVFQLIKHTINCTFLIRSRNRRYIKICKLSLFTLIQILTLNWRVRKLLLKEKEIDENLLYFTLLLYLC